MKHPLCRQVVTVYRKTDSGVERTVLSDCFYSWRDRFMPEGYPDRQCFLVIPANGYLLQPGDRVLDGEGPETVAWDKFVPAAVPGLSQVAWVKHYPTHTEAGHQAKYS